MSLTGGEATASDAQDRQVKFELPDGWTITTSGTTCENREVRASHLSVPADLATDPTRIRFEFGIDCFPTNIQVLPARAPQSPLNTPSGSETSINEDQARVAEASIDLASSTEPINEDQVWDSVESTLDATVAWRIRYHHGWTQILEVASAVTAEFESVGARYWNGRYAWIYDPAWSSLWQFGRQKVYFGWWGNSAGYPTINPVDKDACRRRGPCVLANAKHKARFDVTFFTCTSAHPTVEHHHKDTNTGKVLTLWNYTDFCTGLTAESQDWADNDKYPNQVTKGLLGGSG